METDQAGIVCSFFCSTIDLYINSFVIIKLPGDRVRFYITETLYGFYYAFFYAETGILNSAKGRTFNSVSRYFVNIYRSNFQFFYETDNILHIICYDAT